MLFYPKNSKFKKQQKGNLPNRLNNLIILNRQNTFDSVKLVAASSGRISVKQLTAIRALIKKSIKKEGVLKIGLFPQTPITKKPAEVRMGKGKGAFNQ